jgi:hypothetical protein
LFHQDEDSLWISGIWKPRDNGHFLVHDDDAPLPHVGGYRSNWAGLYDLLQKQGDGELEADKMYTQTIFAPQNSTLNPQYIQIFRQQIQNLSEYTDSGLVHWVGLAEAVGIWEAEFDSRPTIYSWLHGDITDPFACGDADANGVVEIADAVFLINYIFIPGSPPPVPYEAGDPDCSGVAEIADAVYLINFVFVPGSAPPCDPNGDGSLDC